MRTILVCIVTCLFLKNSRCDTSQPIVWKLNTPVYLRGKASMLCMINENNNPGHMAWTKEKQLIGINNDSLNAEKYDVFMKYNKTSMMYYLVIKNIQMDDLNFEYKCESGFLSAKGLLPLNEASFVALPKEEDIFSNFTFQKGFLKFDFDVSSVYPKPRCIVTFKEKNITNYSELYYTKESALYSMKFKLVYRTNECGNINISCVIGKDKLSILQKTLEIEECGEFSTVPPTNNGRLSMSALAVIVTVVFLAAMVVICLVFWFKRRKMRHTFRDQKEIKKWEREQITFVETRATRHILGCLTLNNCIVVTGSYGCGKSSNIHHAALHLRDRFDYEIIPSITGPTYIMEYYNENKRQVFVVDDICGKDTINIQKLQEWIDSSEQMEKIFKDKELDDVYTNTGLVSNVSGPKLLISCNRHIYKESKVQDIGFLTKKECNLLSSELCLLQAEKLQMLHMYLSEEIRDTVNLVMENSDNFPLLCALSKDKSPEEVRKLFTAPFNTIERSINCIIDENKNQFCALVLCILFDDGFNTDWLQLTPAPDKKKEKLTDIVKQFDIDLNREFEKNSLKSAFFTLNGRYFGQKGTEYKVNDDKIYITAAVICGQCLRGCFIKYASSLFIRDHFIFESIIEVDGKHDLIVLSKDQEEKYFERLLCDLRCGIITSTFHNKQLIYKPFINKLVHFLQRNGDTKTILKKFHTKYCIIQNDENKSKYPFETHLDTTPLIAAASGGYVDIVYFLVVSVECDVNETDSQCISPLNKACEGGHTETVELLLHNKADVNQCESGKESPLFVASKGGHIIIVELLLQNNADVNQSDNGGESPLFVASRGGHIIIVELLLQNNADVNQCDSGGESPVFVASKEGHKDIVELLLQNNADVNQCDSGGESSLFVASKEGHKDIVELLLHNNADVNQCDSGKESPLFVASKGGQKDIVELLLQNNADVNQCDSGGESALFVASKGGQKDIVELLLHNNADVNQCDSGGESPLFVASKEGHIYIVQLLLQNYADVHKCDKGGESPLFVASKGGHKDIVELLLQNNADVNQCDSGGESPLCVASKGGHTDTVKLILQNKGNVSKCNDDEKSPLYVAIEEGQTDKVTLLWQNNDYVAMSKS